MKVKKNEKKNIKQKKRKKEPCNLKNKKRNVFLAEFD